MTRTRRAVATVMAIGLMMGTVGCQGSDGPDLSPEAAAGRDVAQEKGCLSCHGKNGDGGVGPTWVGLAGSTVTLEGGSTVVADHAYLAESMTNPTAQVVEGYSIEMPTVALTPDEINAIIDYIDALK